MTEVAANEWNKGEILGKIAARPEEAMKSYFFSFQAEIVEVLDFVGCLRKSHCHV